jgi:hypothetical protein
LGTLQAGSLATNFRDLPVAALPRRLVATTSERQRLVAHAPPTAQHCHQRQSQAHARATAVFAYARQQEVGDYTRRYDPAGVVPTPDSLGWSMRHGRSSLRDGRRPTPGQLWPLLNALKVGERYGYHQVTTIFTGFAHQIWHENGYQPFVFKRKILVFLGRESSKLSERSSKLSESRHQALKLSRLAHILSTRWQRVLTIPEFWASMGFTRAAFESVLVSM